MKPSPPASGVCKLLRDVNTHVRRGIAALAAVVVCFVTAGAGAETLADRIASLVVSRDKHLGAMVAVSVVDLRENRAIAGVKENRIQVPASNQKILTSAFALASLGEDFEFITKVYRCRGDLVIVGDFDPMLGDPGPAHVAGDEIYAELDRWAGVIKQKTSGRIDGDILLVTGRSVDEYRHEDWPVREHRNRYATAIAELNFYNNCFGVTFNVSGRSAIPKVRPFSRLIKVVNQVKLARRLRWSLQLGENDSVITLRGTVNATTRDPWLTAVNNPPVLLGRVLADRLSRAGVAFCGKIRTVKPSDARLSGATVLASSTTPLAVAMTRANKRSINMVSECLFLRAGDGTWAGSAKAMTETLIKNYGLKSSELVVRDGSGLSKSNRITAKGMTKVLSGVSNASVFLESLPISGKDGTLRARLRKSPYRGRIRAKTGYISGVSCLSGYVYDSAATRNAKPVMAFSILANNVKRGKGWQAKKLQDDVCRLLVDSLAGAGE